MKSVPLDIVTQLKNLYRDDRAAQKFLDHAAARRNDASASSIERMMIICDVERAEAVRLAKRFEEIQVASFVVGRRGSPSRVEWQFSLIGLGRSAVGEIMELSPAAVDAEIDDETTEEDNGSSNNQRVSGSLTIAEAKEALARSLGVPPASIEITIRG